jgi:acyl-phosphate glycerol 3-phosphate acyltransferase
MPVMILLDVLGVGYAFFASGSNLLNIVQMDRDLANFTHLFVSFMIGGIPFSVILPLMFFNIKITEQGSKNPGLSNVSRVLSQKIGGVFAKFLVIMCGLLELFKGILPGMLFPGRATQACLVAVLGHIYSPFLGFRGGKGVNTFLGTMFGATGNINFLAPPVAWLILDSNKSAFSLLPVKIVNEWMVWRGVKIKRSFAVSLLVSIYGLFMIVFSGLDLQDKLRFFIIFGIICLNHDEHIAVDH